MPAETVTVGGGDTVTVEVTLPAVTLPAETVTVGGDTVTVTVTETETVNVTLPPVTLPAETVTVEAETVTVTVYGGDTVAPVTLDCETVTLAADRTSNFTLSAYNTTASVPAVNIDGSALKNAIFIYGDSDSNIIQAGLAGGTIQAGTGNDVIYCGRGQDLIYYYSDDDNDTIYNYKTGDRILQERIDQYDDTTFKNVSLDGDDVIINYTNGNKITLKEAKEQQISLRGYTYSWGSLYSYNNTFGNLTISGGTASLAENYRGEFATRQYAASISNVDASSVKNSAINIYANDNANEIRAAMDGGSIYAYGGNDTIYGAYSGTATIRAGAGDDVIYCGRGTDLIYYLSDEGNETVYNYRTGDRILQERIDQYDDTTLKNVSLSGNDVIINYTNGNTITLKDAKEQQISLSGYTYSWGGLYSYNGTAEEIMESLGGSNGNVAVPWFAEDDTNFTTTADLDSLMETPIANSAGALSVGGGDSLSTFTYDFALAHNNDK